MDEIYKEYSELIPSKLIDDVKKEASKVRITKAQLKEILERVKREYEAALISPGEAIGIITAESFGEPATQMSTDFYEKIAFKMNGEFKIVNIGEFVDGIMNIFGYTIINDFSHVAELPYDAEVFALGLNKNGGIEIGRVSEVSRHTFKNKLIKLTTESGKSITATPFHSFVIKEDDKIIVVSAKDLEMGRKLPVVEKNIINNFKDYIVDNNGTEQQLILGNAKWEKIASIDLVKPTKDHVYDLSVPGLETFATFDGIITHNTLNVKHFAGVAEMQVTSGLPRLIEIFDASKSIKTPSMEVYLKPDYNKDPVKVRKIASQIKESTLGDIATEFTIDISAMNVKVGIDRDKLRDLGMTEDGLIKALKDSMKGIQIRTNKNEIVLKTKESDLHEIYKLKEKAKGIFIKGVKGISYVLPVKREGEFIILTSGSNLKEILRVKEVDTKRVVTNDIHEIYSVFGVEAARQAIINESTKVIQNQGLDINIRHIMFIADVMTSAGSVMGITRSGITGGKESVLAKASFETPIRHLISAALNGEEDYLNSVIENVILNQPVPLGTGLPKLVVKNNSK